MIESKLGNKGNIHSIETFATNDGDGIRFIVFMQGCRFKCKFCHNPDTWGFESDNIKTAQEIIDNALQYKKFYQNSGGGITASGGEPLLQPEFIAELFSLAHESGLNTCLDTAGDLSMANDEQLDRILLHTDSVLLDLKETDEEKHKNLTGAEFNTDFLEILHDNKIATILRYVYIKGVNDSLENIERLKELKNKYSNIKRIDVLPYHRLGTTKWKALGSEEAFGVENIPTNEEVDKMAMLLRTCIQ